MADLVPYPLRLRPREVAAVWGGGALVARYGKDADPQAAIGESWECWDENAIVNGALAGESLGGARGVLGARLMGTLDVCERFPILTKFIDARAPLSVQVHPDDAYARRVEGQPCGKTECWYILAAEPGAELILGWTRDTDRAEYERRVADGSLGELLRHVPVAPGETYYLPAGTLHAIGAGIQLFEAQQASDLTYRIFDWNRVGTDGKPRELHVAKAADVLDYRAAVRAAVAPLAFSLDGTQHRVLVAGPQFVLESVGAGATIATHGAPLTFSALQTPLDVATADGILRLAAYETAVVPAAIATLRVDGDGEFLVVRPYAALAGVRADARRAGIEAPAFEAFLSQFA